MHPFTSLFVTHLNLALYTTVRHFSFPVVYFGFGRALQFKVYLVKVHFYFHQTTSFVSKDGFEGANRMFFARWQRWPISLVWKPWRCHLIASFGMKLIIDKKNIKNQLEGWKKIKFYLLVGISVRFPSSSEHKDIWTWRINTQERKGGGGDIRTILTSGEETLNLYSGINGWEKTFSMLLSYWR